MGWRIRARKTRSAHRQSHVRQRDLALRACLRLPVVFDLTVRILADENFPGPVTRELRRCGHDVTSVREVMRGATDREVLAQAQQEERLVVTFDKDFGELAYRFGLPATSGVVLFRLSGASPNEDNERCRLSGSAAREPPY